jgi:hypothetical protein
MYHLKYTLPRMLVEEERESGRFIFNTKLVLFLDITEFGSISYSLLRLTRDVNIQCGTSSSESVRHM